MPFLYNNCDCSPLVIDHEYEIHDENLLAEYVGKILLGHYAHVKRIIKVLANTPLSVSSSDVDMAIAHLEKSGKTIKDIEKRDGWIFQIISWLALFSEYSGKKFYCQQPHDAPAQHGLDGIAIVLNDEMKIESIIITEDKCTENHRVILPDVWKEFKEFESGQHNNKLVSRISSAIESLEDGTVLMANQNNIYKKELRKYRVGINRNEKYQAEAKRKKLFKGYDDCVTGVVPHRRYAATIHKENIRGWMDSFCEKVIVFLESQKVAHV